MTSPQKIMFKTGGGCHCAGDLFLPDLKNASQKRPAIVVSHGFSMVRSMLVQQAEIFRKAGYVVLTIDYRTFGESEGHPRGQKFPLQMVDDFRNAISYVAELPNVDPDRIGIWGTSFGGAMVTYVAAVDRRVKATVAQVPVTDGYIWLKLQRSEEEFVALLDLVDRDREDRLAGKPGATIPVVGRLGEASIMPGSDELKHFTELAREHHPSWRDTVLLESVEKITQFSPISIVNRISPRAYMIITGSGFDIVHPAWTVTDLFERAKEPKRIEFLPYPQLGLYLDPGLTQAANKAVTFYDQHLKM